MKIIQVGINKYIDEELRNHILNIWNNYDVEIPNDSNIIFTKNTTIPRLITDYLDKNINRVRLKEKANYCIINRFNITDYVQFYDGVNICSDETKEPVYGIYNMKDLDVECIKQILDFTIVNPNIKYVNQDVLNNSLNNGFIITEENYFNLKELIDSNFKDNHKLAVNMLLNSSLKDNWEWIIYLYFDKWDRLDDYDENSIISNYISTLGLKDSLRSLLRQSNYGVDKCIDSINNPIIKDKLILYIRNKFLNEVNDFLSNTIYTNKFELKDFKLELK
jgi:hypothetical protein